MKTRIVFHGLMKLVLDFMQKIGEIEISKIDSWIFKGSFHDFLLEFDNSNRGLCLI